MAIPPNHHRSSPFALVVLAAFTLFLLASTGSAVPLFYQIGSGSVTANTAEPGLVIQTMVKPTLAGTSFTLDNGGSFTFSFFDIWTNEPTINADDLVSSPISATLNFLNPVTGATINGVTVGGSWFKGLSQWGQLTWNGPVTITIPNQCTFEISLSDATFNYGSGGLNEGMICGATVDATITQMSSQTPSINSRVPEGGKTALLLGSSLVGLRLFARFRRQRSS